MNGLQDDELNMQRNFYKVFPPQSLLFTSMSVLRKSTMYEIFLPQVLLDNSLGRCKTSSLATKSAAVVFLLWSPCLKGPLIFCLYF